MFICCSNPQPLFVNFFNQFFNPNHKFNHDINHKKLNTEIFERKKSADVINCISEIFQMENFFPSSLLLDFFFPFSLFSLPLPFFYILFDDVLHRFLHRKWLKDLLTEEETHVGSNLFNYRNFFRFVFVSAPKA